jgi:hypothetical protein
MTAPQEPTGASTPEQHTDWWGDPISEERQAELDALAALQRRWAEQPMAMRGDSPLASHSEYVPLAGSDMFWLAQRALAGPEGDAAALAAAETRLRSGELFLDLSARPAWSTPTSARRTWRAPASSGRTWSTLSSDSRT